MKPLHAGLFLLLASFVAAADLEIEDGRIFENYRIISQTPTTVMVRHKGGMAKVEKQMLPRSLQERYPVDEKGAAKEAKEIERGRAVYAKQKKKVEEQRAAEAAAQRELYQKRKAELAPKAKAEDEMIAAHNARQAGQISSEAAERLKEIVEVRARRYFMAERQPTGTNSSLRFALELEIDEPRAVPGWPDRFEVVGVGWYQALESKGAGFVADKGWFRAIVHANRVIDFSPLRSEPQRK